MNIIDGKKIAENINNEVQLAIEKSAKKPVLGIILASNDPSSEVYVKLKMQKCENVGIGTKLFRYDSSITKDKLIEEINKLNEDENISSVLIQLPFYEQLKLDTNEIINTLAFEKDADGLTAIQQARSAHFLANSILPATVDAVLEALNTTTDEDISWQNILANPENITFYKGKNVLIINNTNMIGKPLALVLSGLGATVTIANKFTKDLKQLSQNSDIIVSATGQTNLIDASFIKNDTILIDVTSINTNDGVKGDFVVSDELIKKCSYITPVPGGIGPITVACLLRNVIRLQK